MKITNSSVAMAAVHQEFSYTHKDSASIEVQASKNLPAAILSLSGEAEGKSYMASLQEYQDEQKEKEAQRQKENEEKSRKLIADQLQKSPKVSKGTGRLEMSDEYKMKLEMIKQLFAMLRNGIEIKGTDVNNLNHEGGLDLRSASYRRQEESSLSVAVSASVSAASTGSAQIGTNVSGTTWQRVTVTSGFTSESETTTFASKGIVATEDGRNIDFNIEVSMSRAFMSNFDQLQVQNYVKTDPLMINLDTNVGHVSEQKFYFDLDADGKEENISFAGKGSGFLALDKNGDGKINDGSELFGTKSGDGFRDLAEYDEDKNGWIDENDSIFGKLRVWTKDEDGRDYLMDLKQADVGAIYLGNKDTQFSLKDDSNQLNGEIKKTGIYLRESNGTAGTLNHVDLVL